MCLVTEYKNLSKTKSYCEFLLRQECLWVKVSFCIFYPFHKKIFDRDLLLYYTFIILLYFRKYLVDVSFFIAFFLQTGDLADLIFVFFDPIGQALCKRTLNIVEELSHKHSEIMRFYLSKADEAGDESDRQVYLHLCFQGLDDSSFFLSDSNHLLLSAHYLLHVSIIEHSKHGT